MKEKFVIIGAIVVYGNYFYWELKFTAFKYNLFLYN